MTPETNPNPHVFIHLHIADLNQPPAPLQIQIASFDGDMPTLTLGKTAGDLSVVRSGDQAVLWVSLGKREKVTLETFRKAGGSAGKWLRERNATATDLDFSQFDPFNLSDAGEAFLTGLCLGAYRFDRHKEASDPPGKCDVYLRAAPDDVRDSILSKVAISAEAVLLAREWGHEPANIVNPVTLAERVVALAAEHGLHCTILDENALGTMNAGAILAVGKGSQTPPRVIVLEYPGKRGQKPVLLIGKALTFDSGGYSIKDTTNIQGMKYDKCGGITVVATLIAAAKLGLEQPLIGVVGAAENMISAQAYRPDDIITTLSGKTVEIVSTDAEGRLVLADVLTYVQKNWQPRAMIDLATLTGGVVVALGRVRAGLMSNNVELAHLLTQAGERTGERVWQLPLDEEYLQSTKGDDADLKNSGGREGHAILGGIFLKQFVDDSIPWAHLDIAGMADTPKDLPYCPKGATGFGVRLLLDYLNNLQ